MRSSRRRLRIKRQRQRKRASGQSVARYYDPAVGRFLSIDPIRFKSGDIHKINNYEYTNNNPVVNIDSDGRATNPEDVELVDPEGKIESYADLLKRGLDKVEYYKTLRAIQSFDPNYRAVVVVGPEGEPNFNRESIRRMEKTLRWYQDNACTEPSHIRGDPNNPPKRPNNFLDPTNSPQSPPSAAGEGGSIRIHPPNDIYENGYWRQYNEHNNPIDPSTGKESRSQDQAVNASETHVPLPASWWGLDGD